MGYSHKLCASVTLAHLEIIDPYRSMVLYIGWCLPFFFGTVQSTFQYHEPLNSGIARILKRGSSCTKSFSGDGPHGLEPFGSGQMFFLTVPCVPAPLFPILKL